MKKLLNPETSDQETLCLKAVVNAMELNSPEKIAESTLNRASKKTKNRHPDLFR